MNPRLTIIASALRKALATQATDPYWDSVVLSIPIGSYTAPTGDMYWNNVVLMLPMDGVGGSTSITDARGSTISRFGDTHISTAQSRFGGASCYFDGAGDQLQTTAVSIQSTEDFTIELWVNPSYITGNTALVEEIGSRKGLIFLSNGTLYWLGSSDLNTGVKLSTNTWAHVAVSRVSGVTRVFKNGVLAGSASDTCSFANGFTIGNDIYSQYFNGYMDDLRITKGVGRYSINFPVPTAACPTTLDTTNDPYWNDVVIAMPFEGVDGSTTITDLKGHTVTRNGDTKLSAAQKVSGSSSVYFDGTGDYIDFSTNEDFSLGAKDFTIEFWFYPTDTTRMGLFAYTQDYSIGIDYSYNGTRNINIWASSNGTSWDMLHADSGGLGIGTISIPLNSWSHIAYCRRGNTFTSFVNGVVDRYITVSGSIYTTNRGPRIGVWGQLGYPTKGYIDDLRVTRGISRYLNRFTPATYPLPTTSKAEATFDKYGNNTVLAMHMTGASGSTSFVDQCGNTVTTNGNAQISTTQKAFGTSSAYFDGSRDYLYITSSPSWAFPGDFTIEFWINTSDSSFCLVSTGVSGGLTIGYNVDNNGQGWGIWKTGVGPDYVTSTLMSANTWHHVAVTRRANSVRIFLDGTQIGTTSTVTTSYPQGALYISADGLQPNFDFGGYIQDLRITNGVARYTSNFTVQAQAFIDPFVDLKGHSIIRYGDTAVSTSRSMYGGASCYFDGVNDCLRINNPYTVFGTMPGDFTMECWVNWQTLPPGNAYGNERQILGQHNWAENASSGNWWGLFGVSTGLQFYVCSGGSSELVSAAFTWAVNTWYYLAVVRSGSTVKLFLNGQLVGTGTSTKPLFADDTRPLTIGADMGADACMSNFYLDDLRITKGIARYSDNFIPPAAPFPTK